MDRNKEHPHWVTMVCKNIPKEGDTSKSPPTTPREPLPPLHSRGVRTVVIQLPRLPYHLTRWLVAATPSSQFLGGRVATWKESMSPSD
jgi:hypothetical protein